MTMTHRPRPKWSANLHLLRNAWLVHILVCRDLVDQDRPMEDTTGVRRKLWARPSASRVSGSRVVRTGFEGVTAAREYYHKKKPKTSTLFQKKN